MLKYLQALYFFGRPFGLFYGLAMQIREKLYKNGLLRQHCLPVPVISVGNLVMGGTGKTPTVRHLANLLLLQGYQPAIISRGYRGKAKQCVNVVSDRDTIYLSPEMAGDEPYMLAESLPGVAVLTGTNRIHPCQYAIENFRADVLILDDGFQHLAVRRDIDIVLFDGTSLAGNQRVFPGGSLREPFSALGRCDAFLLTGISEQNSSSARLFADFLKTKTLAIPTFFATTGKLSLQCPDEENFSGAVPEGTTFAFCGIANPCRFEESLRNIGIHLNGFMALPDHVHYTQALMTDICEKALASGSMQLITTQKDYVKLKTITSQLVRFVAAMEFHGDADFDLFVLNALNTLQKTKDSAG